MLRRMTVFLLVALILPLTGCTLLNNLPDSADTEGEDQVSEVDLTATARAGMMFPDLPPTPSDPALINPTPMDMPAPTGQPGGTCGLGAAFLDDMTIPDGTTVPAGEVFEKTWRLLNNGCADWPEGTKLMHVGGLALGAPPAVPVDPVAVNAIADAPVLFRAPVMPGPYRSFWQLATAEGLPFGQVVHVDIISTSAETEAMMDEMLDDVMEQMEQDEMEGPPIDDPTLELTTTPTPEPTEAPADGGGDDTGDSGDADGGGDGGGDGGDGPTLSLLPTPSIQLFGFPDLVVEYVDIQPNPVEVGQPVTLTVQMKNQGVVDSPPYTVTVAAGDQSVTESLPALPAGLSERLDVQFTFDTAGAYTYLITVDVPNDVAEVDENNNAWVAALQVRENLNMTNARSLSFDIKIGVFDDDTLSNPESNSGLFMHSDVTDGVFIESKRWDVCADDEVEGTVIVNYYVDTDGSMIVDTELVLTEGPSCSWGNAVVDRYTTTLIQPPDTTSEYYFQLVGDGGDMGFFWITLSNQTP